MNNTSFALLTAQALLVLTLNGTAAWGYGGGSSGGSSCAEAKFYEETPARDSKVAALSDIALVASDNTEIASLDLQVNGKPLKPEVTQRRSGEWDIKVHLPEAISQPGKVRISLTAKSKEGCETFFPYYLQVGP